MFVVAVVAVLVVVAMNKSVHSFLIVPTFSVIHSILHYLHRTDHERRKKQVVFFTKLSLYCLTWRMKRADFSSSNVSPGAVRAATTACVCAATTEPSLVI